MAFFARRAKQSYVVVDLGYRSIKVAVFEKPAAGETALVNVQKTVIKLISGSKSGRMLASLHELLAEVLKKERNPQKIIIGIGPNIADISLQEWTTDSLHLREPLGLAHVQTYFQELFNEHRDETHASLGYPVSIEMNGYPIDMRSFVLKDSSLIKKITFRTIMLRFTDEVGSALSEFKKMLGGVEIEFVPLPAVTAEALVAACKIRNGVLVDVGSSMSTLVLVLDGRLMQVSSFPIGTERFSHRIVKTRGGKFVEAEDLTRQYAHGLITQDERVKVSHVFSEEAVEWKKACMSALETCYPIAPLPQDFYLYGGGSYIPEVRSALWSRDILKNSSPFESPHVSIVQASQIFNNTSFNGVFGGPEDVGLASLAYHSLHHTVLF